MTNEVSFENALIAIESGGLLDVIKHPKKDKYPSQKIMVVNINNYTYLVPFVENEKKILENFEKGELVSIFPNFSSKPLLVFLIFFCRIIVLPNQKGCSLLRVKIGY